ncbi:MAG TPA: ADP-ribosylglycohydrolase family protein [Anaerolineaceae bacterium]|nr:ADP-ribosylglycohydrolase family protein [Anaerolineaceae bacterium]
MGEDTDSIAAIAGGLAGIKYGLDAIPKDWLDALQAKDVIESCLF